MRVALHYTAPRCVASRCVTSCYLPTHQPERQETQRGPWAPLVGFGRSRQGRGGGGGRGGRIGSDRRRGTASSCPGRRRDTPRNARMSTTSGQASRARPHQPQRWTETGGGKRERDRERRGNRDSFFHMPRGSRRPSIHPSSQMNYADRHRQTGTSTQFNATRRDAMRCNPM